MKDLTQADRQHVFGVTRPCEGFFCLLFSDLGDVIDILFLITSLVKKKYILA